VLKPGETAYFKSRLAIAAARGRNIDVRFFNKAGSGRRAAPESVASWFETRGVAALTHHGDGTCHEHAHGVFVVGDQYTLHRLNSLANGVLTQFQFSGSSFETRFAAPQDEV